MAIASISENEISDPIEATEQTEITAKPEVTNKADEPTKPIETDEPMYSQAEPLIEPAVQVAQLAGAGINKMAKAISTAVLGVASASEEAATEESASQPIDPAAKELLTVVHKTTKRVSSDLNDMGFNTAIAALMEYVNALYKLKTKGFELAEWRYAIETLQQLLAPFAPHITEELWHQLGNETSVHTSNWPLWDEAYLIQDTLTIALQVNGKVRGTLVFDSQTKEEDIIEAAKSDARVVRYTKGQTITKTIYVTGKLVSIVAS